MLTAGDVLGGILISIFGMALGAVAAMALGFLFLVILWVICCFIMFLGKVFGALIETVAHWNVKNRLSNTKFVNKVKECFTETVEILKKGLSKIVNKCKEIICRNAVRVLNGSRRLGQFVKQGCFKFGGKLKIFFGKIRRFFYKNEATNTDQELTDISGMNVFDQEAAGVNLSGKISFSGNGESSTASASLPPYVSQSSCEGESSKSRSAEDVSDYPPNYSSVELRAPPSAYMTKF